MADPESPTSDNMTARMPESVRLCALMVSYQAGRLEAFDELYALTSPLVRRYLGSRVAVADRVEDLVQESYLQMHRARHTYDPAYPLTPWVIAIARHVWLMDRRSRSRRPQPTLTLDAVDLAVRAEAEAFAEKTQVRRALATLKSARRLAVIRHHVWGFSFRDIARSVGIGEAAAKLRSSRGMAELRRELQRDTFVSPRGRR